MLCGGCTASGWRLNLAPLIDIEQDADNDHFRLAIGGPILTYEQLGKKSLFTVRPLMSVYNRAPSGTANDVGESAVHVLYPFVRHRKRGKEERFMVLPIYYGETYYDASGRRDSDYVLIPFFWAGSGDDPDDNYFAFFPFFGRINGKFGLDQLDFVMFPIWVRTRFGNRVRTNICWPLSTLTGSGEDDDDKTVKGFRTWPIFGNIKKEGKYTNTFVLWPFYTASETGLDTDSPTRAFSIFPFYSQETGKHSSNKSYLIVFSFGRDDRTNYKSVSFPWPLVVFESSDHHIEKRVVPFWRYSRRGNVETYAYLHPLIWAEYEKGDKWSKSSLWVLPLFWTHLKEYEDSEMYDRFVKIWPLMAYHHDEDGTEKAVAMSLLWFRDPDGFERNWSPLWQVYNSIRRPNRTSRTDILWGLFRHSSDGKSSYTDITPLFGTNTTETGGGFSILKGLFGVQKEKGETSVRLFWFIEI